jgi:hypothetical protein
MPLMSGYPCQNDNKLDKGDFIGMMRSLLALAEE